MQRIRRFFARLRHLTPAQIGIIGLIIISVGVILLAAPPAWEYSNSAEFCGTVCHTMPPQYQTYLESPHARVQCVDCHIGRDLLLVQFLRKSEHLRLVTDTIFENYELPIYAHSMRPASETCEVCHSPEQFSDDSLRVINTYESNETNDPYSIYLLMHTGGGSAREGLGRGIHWHIENPMSYIALDEQQQEIPYIRVENADGTVTEYTSLNSPIDMENLDQYEMQEMDCATCHNRVAHEILTPSNAVDKALRAGDISTEIPYIRARAIELLAAPYATTDEAIAAFDTLNQYYSDYYPEFYAQNPELVQSAVDILGTLYLESNFPEQLLTYNTHPNNTGHDESAGCFRCHDGQHFSAEGEAIRLECNLCHSIPQVVRPGQVETTLPISSGVEPESHLTTAWISQHSLAFDATCANCHTVGNPGGVDNSSFCSNSACHGSSWQYAGFDAPGLAAKLGYPQLRAAPLLEDFEGDPTYTILQPLFQQECGTCHGTVPNKGLRLTDYESAIAGSVDGPVFVAGDPEGSRMIQVFEEGHFAELTEHQLDLIRTWIANGMPQ
ncbi:MAG: NapC/NirT family cytochrome c [Anaerolineae bacterium]